MVNSINFKSNFIKLGFSSNYQTYQNKKTDNLEGTKIGTLRNIVKDCVSFLSPYTNKETRVAVLWGLVPSTLFSTSVFNAHKYYKLKDKMKQTKTKADKNQLVRKFLTKRILTTVLSSAAIYTFAVNLGIRINAEKKENI